jgi:hypothetical protein
MRIGHYAFERRDLGLVLLKKVSRSIEMNLRRGSATGIRSKIPMSNIPCRSIDPMVDYLPSTLW